MTVLVGRYPEAVFSDIDFDAEPTIWVWPSNAASQQADPAHAIAWLREESAHAARHPRVRRPPVPQTLAALRLLLAHHEQHGTR